MKASDFEKSLENTYNKQVKPTPAEEKCCGFPVKITGSKHISIEVGGNGASPTPSEEKQSHTKPMTNENLRKALGIAPTPSAQEGWVEDFKMAFFVNDGESWVPVVSPELLAFQKRFISSLLLQQRIEIEESVRGSITKIANDVAHAEAKKWEHEQTWKQPYAGNRIVQAGWEIEKEITSSLDKLFATNTLR
jgi:hypothetical protein